MNQNPAPLAPKTMAEYYQEAWNVALEMLVKPEEKDRMKIKLAEVKADSTIRDKDVDAFIRLVIEKAEKNEAAANVQKKV